MAIVATGITANAQIDKDSIDVRIIPSYDHVSKIHRKIFGENYRKEYALETKIPVIHLSKISGGLTAFQKGGGNQSHTLRLRDKSGREWVLRNVEKFPEGLLPISLRSTFAKDVLKDNMSAQHPFSALIVSDLAEAGDVPHANPIIGWISPDIGLGIYADEFSKTVCMLELREPLGNSDNTAKMYHRLQADHNISVDAVIYLRARALDVLIGDWDRHEDQWRWKLLKSPAGSIYVPVPRDRDQVFFGSDGWIQRYLQSSSLLPMMQGYERNVQNINWFLWEGRELNSRIFANITEEVWNKTIDSFCEQMTDEVFEKALFHLPMQEQGLKYQKLLAQLKLRRQSLPMMMNQYYHWFNQIVDVELSNKDERITLTDTFNKGLNVTVNSISPISGEKHELFNRTFDPAVTQEIRVYLRSGNDSLELNNLTSKIKLRIIGGGGKKNYVIQHSAGRTILYDKPDSAYYSGKDKDRISKRIKDDSVNTAYKSKDLYRRQIALLNAAFNKDEGLSAGLILKQMNPGFRKVDFGNTQSVSFLYAFKTSAFKFNYLGEWNQALGDADLIVQSTVKAPHSQNYFGAGNQSVFDELNHEVGYYRVSFSLYQLDPAIRWRNEKTSLTIGPSIQQYRFNHSENENTFIQHSSLQGSSDSINIDKRKAHAGVLVRILHQSKEVQLLPKAGVALEVNIRAYKGISTYSRSFGQLDASYSIYKKIDAKGNLVIANRIGGGITLGNATFYQLLSLGGQGNLLGFRQFRFSGKHAAYNNLEIRLKVADFISYILPGEFGTIILYDVGRVWQNKQDSNVIHQGVGGGFYFAPASLTVVRLVAAHSKEGWYPYAALRLRF